MMEGGVVGSMAIQHSSSINFKTAVPSSVTIPTTLDTSRPLIRATNTSNPSDAAQIVNSGMSDGAIAEISVGVQLGILRIADLAIYMF